MCGTATTCVNSDASNLLNNGHCASRYKAHVWPRLCIRLAGCSFSCSDGARCDTGRQPLTLAAKGALRRSSVVCAKVGGQYPPQGLWQAIAGLFVFLVCASGRYCTLSPWACWSIACRPALLDVVVTPFGSAARLFAVTIFIRKKFEDSTLETCLAFMRRSRSCAVLDSIDRCFEHCSIPGDNRIHGAGGAIVRR